MTNSPLGEPGRGIDPRSEQWGPVVIGPREIYDAIVRVSAKVDTLAHEVVQLAKDGADREARLRALERARWPLPSIAVLVSLASLVLSLLKR